LGAVLSERDPKRAVSVFDLGIQRLGETGNGPKAQRDTAVLLANSSYPLRRLGKSVEAKIRVERALAMLKRTGDYPAAKVRLGGEPWTVVSAMADLEAETGDPRGALQMYEDLMSAVMAGTPDPLHDLRSAPKMARMYERLSDLYRRTEENGRAAEMDRRRSELWESWAHALPHCRFVRGQLAMARPQLSRK
jgi:hypothetical protein